MRLIYHAQRVVAQPPCFQLSLGEASAVVHQLDLGISERNHAEIVSLGRLLRLAGGSPIHARIIHDRLLLSASRQLNLARF